MESKKKVKTIEKKRKKGHLEIVHATIKEGGTANSQQMTRQQIGIET